MAKSCRITSRLQRVRIRKKVRQPRALLVGGSEGDSNQGYVATANCFAYANEHLARPGQVVESNPDADDILPLTLEQRSDGIIPVNQW